MAQKDHSRMHAPSYSWIKVVVLSPRQMKHLHLWAMWLTTHAFGSISRRNSGTFLWRDNLKITWCGCNRWFYMDLIWCRHRLLACRVKYQKERDRFIDPLSLSPVVLRASASPRIVEQYWQWTDAEHHGGKLQFTQHNHFVAAVGHDWQRCLWLDALYV